MHGKFGNLPTRIWTGVTYWDTARDIGGEVMIGGSNIKFVVEQGPVTEWSIILGTSIEPRKEIQIVIELQALKDVFAFVGGLTFRF